MQEFLHSFTKLELDKVKASIQRYLLSDLGRDHLENMRPSANLNEIRHSIGFVTEYKALLELDDSPPLDHLPDVRESLKRAAIENYYLSPEELRAISLLLETSRKIHGYFARRRETYPLLGAMTGGITVDKVIEYNINQAIDEEGKVKDNATKELQSIRRQIIEQQTLLRKSLQTILKSATANEWAQDEIMTTREGRMVIAVKSEFKNYVPGFIHSSSSSGATVYIEPAETLEMNNETRSLHFQEQREVEKILRTLTKQLGEVLDRLVGNARILGILDFIQAKAKYSIQVIGAEPVLKTDGPIRLSEARHPILLQRHRREEVVPLSMELPDSVRTLVITGPNAGGKSVVLKTVGLLTIMAQAGCHIPAAPETELRLFSEIFVDIGDEQSLEDDLSSFSSHLQNMNTILSSASPRSLVLVDEIGSGTDPSEGASLAAAILEKLSATGCLTIVTTHHGMLKTFAFETPHFMNGGMEFDQETLRPLYRFRAGVPGSSYAIEMAQRLNLDSTIIDRSRDLKGSGSAKIENLIVELERQSQDLTKNLDEVSGEKIRLDQLTRHYETKIKGLEKELREIRSKALDEAKTLIDRANAVIEKTVRDIRESGANRDIARKARDEVKAIRGELREIARSSEQQESPASPFQTGDYVHIISSGVTGEITAVLEHDQYQILAGNLKLKVHRKDLQTAQRQHQPAPGGATVFEPGEVHREIDLRGMYGDEAITAIDKFIDTAVLSGLHRIDIIHGKGTGALRKKITEYLKVHPSIQSYRLGEWNEGGTGVTVVELK